MRKNVALRPEAMTLHKLAEAYRTTLQTLGHSKKGSQAKYRFLLEFLARLEQQGITEMNQVATIHIHEHYYYLLQRPNYNREGTLSKKSAASHLQAIQLFFSQLQIQKQIRTNPVSALNIGYPRQANQRQVITQMQIKQLYNQTRNHKERAMLSLSYGCGLRAAELEALNLEDVKLHERTVIVRKGKNNKRRVIPINYKVAEDLQNYLSHERPELVQTKAFILNSKHRRMKYYTWNKELQQIAERAGIKAAVTTHVLRHSIATHLIQQGAAVEQVRKFLGHSQLETTQVYTHINPIKDK
ncbi:MAG: tyrosine-type recombinase/integrase [Cyclobacteriaceae bacterium]